EIDLCLRLKNRGYSVAYCPESVVYHVGGGTLQTGSPFKTLLNFRNNLALIVKNHHSSPLIPKVLVRMVLDGVKGLEALLKGRFSETAAILRAHGQFYHRLPKLLKQRRNEQKARMEPNENGLYKGSLLWNFFVLKNRQFSQFKPGVPIKDL
ncbi:MAG TPA: glycosyltransferase family 2 protein, partial [Luteibaculaceae bacterium]|nr:glycosyltransferase family 2 protein [Luteibaculaceae bacterium]